MAIRADGRGSSWRARAGRRAARLGAQFSIEAEHGRAPMGRLKMLRVSKIQTRSKTRIWNPRPGVCSTAARQSKAFAGIATAVGRSPDLRASAVVLDAETFERIVGDGALTAAGMRGFPDLTDRELESLRH
jgi:hypothetical protein